MVHRLAGKQRRINISKVQYMSSSTSNSQNQVHLQT